MSRIGKKPIAIPAGVTVNIEDNLVTVTGKLGTLSQRVSDLLKVEINGAEIVVSIVKDTRESNSLHGLTRTLIANMVEGVSTGFTKDLVINGVGAKVFSKDPRTIEMKLGFSHPVVFSAPEGITLTVPSVTEIRVFGFDKQLVGQVAANIRAIKRVEPYHSYGIRYANEVVVKKEGKTAAKK